MREPLLAVPAGVCLCAVGQHFSFRSLIEKASSIRPKVTGRADPRVKRLSVFAAMAGVTLLRR
jgi:hypothetical protein